MLWTITDICSNSGFLSELWTNYQFPRNRRDSLRKFYWNLDGKKVPSCECMFVHRQQVLFLSAHADDIKMTGKKQNMAPIWKKLMKHVDLDEPTSFLDHVYLGCTQRACKPNEIIEKLPGWAKPHEKQLRGPETWKDMPKNALGDITSWQTKRQSSFTQFQVPAWMITISKRRNLNQLEMYQKCARNYSSNACTWHELVDPTFHGQ